MVPKEYSLAKKLMNISNSKLKNNKGKNNQ